MEKKLTDKQNLFIKEYLISLNATDAAIKAGYSKKTAQRIGSENLSKPLIAKEINKEQDKTSKKLEISRESILKDLQDILSLNKLDTPTHALKSIEIINKMLGYNAIDKQEITLKGEQPLFTEDEDED